MGQIACTIRHDIVMVNHPFFLSFFFLGGGGRGVKNHSKNPYDLKQQIAFHQIRYFGACKQVLITAGIF